ncbi:hypothetical protein VTH82DRAFT_3897 [Thermothelomyces myriococcoides]
MSAPYWGQLPPPHVGQTKARRLSDDTAQGRQSLDGPAQVSSRSNRISVQTTKSDAPTESTRSPFTSPTASSFAGHGLTPRPPSLPYGADQYPPELTDNRRRRRSRAQEQDTEYAPSVTNNPPPPAAPDAPRAPPPSSQYAYTASSAQPSYPPKEPPVQGIGRQDSQKENQGNIGQKTQPPERARDMHEESIAFQPQRVGTDPSLGSMSPLPNGRQRRASAAEQSLQKSARRRSAAGRPKTFADVRSPLQRLELTLDSISKEDKRARVEAAERAARERAATAKEGAAQQPSVPAGDMPTTPIASTRPARDGGPLSQNPPDFPMSDDPAGPISKTSPPSSRIPPQAQSSGIPQRNLSFRERAARGDVKIPDDLDVLPSREAAGPPAGPDVRTPPRSGAGRLKKNSQAEPWPTRVSESDDIDMTAEMAAPGPQVAGTPARAVPPRAAYPSGYSPSDRARYPPTTDSNTLNDDFAEELMLYSSTGRPTKGPGQGKADQVLGRAPVQTTAGTDGDTSTVVSFRAISPPPASSSNSTAYPRAAPGDNLGPGAPAEPGRRDDTNWPKQQHQQHHMSDVLYHARDKFQPGQGVFKPPTYLDEWRKGTVGVLSGNLLDLDETSTSEKNSGRWDGSQGRRRSDSLSSRPKKAEAFEGEYDEKSNAPTRFKPPLYLKCGPLLRFCGIRHERVPSRSARAGSIIDREFWRGSIMIMTSDADSSYDIAPILRLFVQPIELLPTPPREVQGDLAPEYIDPIAGHPKLGRKGETLYVRPVDHLEEAKDLSRDETDDGLYEKSKSPPDFPLPDGMADPPGSFAARRKRAEMDGEKAGKYKEIRGFRLHTERGYTFWRFNIEIELREKQQRIAYRINRGPSTGFWVPAKGQSMNIMFHSCNGFSLSADPNQFSGPDPMWRDVLNTHQSQPFHLMIGGGDQIYNDRCMQDTTIFKEWLMIKNPLHKHNAPFTPEMQDELERFYLERYAMWFSQGLFAMANAQIPMVNMWDDHDIIDGFGSYPHHFMNSPVFSGLGNVAFKYYMLFQHQSVVTETEKTEPSWLLGVRPGPYINELSRSLFMFLGGKVALLAVDARTERTRERVMYEDTWKKIMDRCYAEIDKGKVEHLLVVLGVPIAYPRLVWLENILTSRVMDPVKALAKLGMFGGLLNRFDGGVEVLDDLDDHWTAKCHKKERSFVIEDLQDLAADKSVRVTILSGDVHLAAVGQFYSNPKHGLAKHKDFRYIPNIISSAIANTPPPDLLADVLNKRNKVHHFDKDTDEDMIPLFAHGVDGKPRNNKHLLPHRNWCAIREYVPGHTPSSTPDHFAFDGDSVGSIPGTLTGDGRRRSGIFRRLTRSKTFGPEGKPKDRSRPPVSGGLLRSFSRRAMAASADEVGRSGPTKQGLLTRTLSSTSVSSRIGGIFRRRSLSEKGRDDGGINGAFGSDAGNGDPRFQQQQQQPEQYGGRPVGSAGPSSLRGGLGSHSAGYNSEYDQGDENSFSVRAPYPHPGNNYYDDDYHPPAPPKPVMTGGTGAAAQRQASRQAQQQQQQEQDGSDFTPKPFRRAPTTLSAKQRKALGGGRLSEDHFAVDLQGALEVTLNVEISPRDPAGSTVPYRLVVPRLWYEYEPEEDEEELGGESETVGTGTGTQRGDGTGSVVSASVAATAVGEKKPGIKRLLTLKKGV